MIPKPKVQTPPELRRQADEMFSIIIRSQYAGVNGKEFCFVCGICANWHHLQCGHFLARGNYKARYSEINCKPICPDCNRKQKFGDKEVEEKFRDKLIQMYGEEEVEKLKKDYKIHKLYKSDYIEMIEKFKIRIGELQ